MCYILLCEGKKIQKITGEGEKYVKHLICVSCAWGHCIVGQIGEDGWVNSQGT